MILAGMRFLERLTEFGVPYADTKSEKRNIIMSNYLSLISSAVPLILLIYRLFLSSLSLNIYTILTLSFAFIFLLPIALNSIGKKDVSRILVCWLPSFYIFILVVHGLTETTQFNPSYYIAPRFYLLAFCSFPFLVYELRNKEKLALALSAPLFILFFFDYILNLIGIGYYQVGLHEPDYEFYNIRVAIVFLILAASTIFLRRLSEKNESVNEQLLLELEEKNNLIQRQAQSEVLQLNDQLKLNLQQLSEREFILNQSQRIAKIGSWEYRIEHDYLFWSDEMYAIFGLDKSFNIKTGNLNEALGEEGSERITKANVDLLRTGNSYDITIRTKTPIGYTKWFRVYAFPILEQNNAVGVRGICHDITFFKEAEEKLRAGEAKFSKVFDNYPDLIMVVRESDLLVVDINPKVVSVLGFEKQEVIGRSARAMDLFLTEDERQVYIENYSVDGYVEFECSWKRKDGRIIEVNITGIRMNIDGQFYRMSVVKDVTDQKQAEEEKEYARHQLNERIKELTTLYRTSQILHDEKKSLEEVFTEITTILPSGWQYPEIAVARIDLGGIQFSSPNFENAKHKQRAEFLIQPNAFGTIEVAYTEDTPLEIEGPFFAEERDLINMVAEMLGEHLVRKHEQESLIKSQANLKATINNTEVLIWSVDRQFRLIMFNTPFFEYIKKYYGVEPKIGRRVFDPMDDDETTIIKTRWKENYTRALAGEIVTLEETRFGFDFQYSLSPIIEDNMVSGVSIFADNVTARKTQDRELAEANKKIGEMKLMALRSVMNPHFIFNVLNSIQFFIAKNDRLNAITYLSTFSKLIRSILTHSVNNKISLTDEIDMLKNYVQLEMVRFENKFSFTLNVDSAVDLEAIEIPSLLIQPYVENAILHGLYNKVGSGSLKIDIYEENDAVIFQIEDDGIGREAALKLREQNFPTHKSMGIKLTEERLQLINQKHNVAFEVLDLKNDYGSCGTRVRIGVIY